MAYNFCASCGSKLVKVAKFCSHCGNSVAGVVEKTKPRRSMGWLFLFLAILMGIFAGIFFSMPNKQGEVPGVMFSIFSAGFYLATMVVFFRWILAKNKYVGIGILILIIIIASLLVVQNQLQKVYLYQIQQIEENAASVAYAKSIGDDLMVGRKISSAVFLSDEDGKFSVLALEKITSMSQVYERVNQQYGKIKAKKVKPEVEDLRKSTQVWTEAIVNASNLKNGDQPTRDEKTKWQKLPTTPNVVFITLESNRRVAAFESQVSQIKKLKNSGDKAIANDNPDSMRQVFANAQIASNFVESISYKTSNVCGRGGCAPEVKTFMTGVIKSAHNYIVGNQSAAKDWDNTWKNAPEIIKAPESSPLGGLGINQGAVEPTPPPNPSTTIRNVTPFKRIQPAVASWDGVYSSTTNIDCDAAAGDFADSFADSAMGNFEVRDNHIVGSNIAIDDDGQANYFVDIAGVSVTVNYYFTNTADGGVSVSGDFTSSASAEGATAFCSGSFSGSRISL